MSYDLVNLSLQPGLHLKILTVWLAAEDEDEVWLARTSFCTLRTYGSGCKGSRTVCRWYRPVQRTHKGRFRVASWVECMSTTQIDH